MADEHKEDITIRLAIAGLDPESVDPAEMGALLHEAIIVIETLRAMIGRKEDISLNEIEPEGNA